MGNNPVKLNDPSGDTSIFYSYQGKSILTVNDKGPNRTVVLSENNEEAFYRSYYENFALVPVDKET